MKNPKFLFSALIIILAASMLLISCANTPAATTTSSITSTSNAQTTALITTTPNANTPTNATPASGGTLKYFLDEGTTGAFGWPAQQGGGTAPDESAACCIESLLMERADGTIIPWLATDWKLSPDQKSVTLTLRQGVKFQDGTDFNATAAKWNLDQAIANKVPGTQGWDSVQVINDYTVQINLNTYTNELWSDLASIAGAMVSPTAYNDHGLDWVKTHPVGTGPFKFVSFEDGANVKYERFDDYWGGTPLLDGVEYLVVPDPATQEAMIETGQLDVLPTADPKVMSDLTAKDLKSVYMANGTVVLFPDSANSDSPFAKQQVREALSYAIDRNALVKMAGSGTFQPAFQLPIPGLMGYMSDFQNPQYNPDKAKELLTEAGYPDGFKTTIIPMPTVVDTNIIVAVQSYLKAVGIQANIETVTMGKYMDYRMKGWNNAIMCQPLAVWPNYNQTIDAYFDSTQFPSLGRPSELKDLVTAAFSTPTESPDKTDAVLNLLYNNETVIPVYYMGISTFLTNTVHNANFGDYLVYYYANWEKISLSK